SAESASGCDVVGPENPARFAGRACWSTPSATSAPMLLTHTRERQERDLRRGSLHACLIGAPRVNLRHRELRCTTQQCADAAQVLGGGRVCADAKAGFSRVQVTMR